MHIVDPFEELNEIGSKIVTCAIDVHKFFGPGMLESLYHKSLEHALRLAGLSVRSEVLCPATYMGLKIDAAYRLDLLVEEKVIVEVKSVIDMNPVFFAQTLTYLRLCGLKLAYLINFNVMLLKYGIKRIVL